MLVHFMQNVQFLSIYIRKGLTYRIKFTRVPIGQYKIQCTILPFLREIKAIIKMPVMPKPVAAIVAVITGTSSHRSIRVTVITRIRRVVFIAVLFLRTSFLAVIPEARLSKAPK